MKKLILSISLLFLVFGETAYACTVSINGLRKEFRRSGQVFIGEFFEFTSEKREEMPEHLSRKWETLGKANFRIKKSWKGQRSGEIPLFFNVACDCPMRYLIPNKGQEMLIFADKDGVIDSCNLQYVIEMKDEKKRAEVKGLTDKLNSFWFRTWAKVYPF